MNLGNKHEEISNFILSSIKEAENEFDGINSIGIYISPINGWISLNVNKNSKLEQTNFNCPDFDYFEYKLLVIKEIENEVNEEDPEFNYSNKNLKWNGNNEVLNKFMFKFLISWVMPSITSEFKMPLLLQMLDSQYSHIWNVGNNVQYKFENSNKIFEPKEINISETKIFKWVKGLFKG